MYDVIALGELLIDFASKSTDEAGYPTMAANPGGAPGNFLAALNAYGARTAFLGKVGDDAFGHLLLGTLHTGGAVNTVDRIIDTFPADQDETAKEQVRSIAKWLNSPELPPEFTNMKICAYRK
mgnify:CR=1 FL=1